MWVQQWTDDFWFCCRYFSADALNETLAIKEATTMEEKKNKFAAEKE